MPLTHERTFRVRAYECDGYGYVHNANFLRYMQEAAFDASAAAGYDTHRYDEMGHSWLIRETDIEYLHRLRYGDSVRVKTWVDDFRRIRSRRAYEFRRVDDSQLVARASTDWVFLNTTTGHPATIPSEMKSAFFPEGPPDTAPPRKRFPSAPPPPPGVFKVRRRAEWRDLDSMQHVNNATYLTYLEDCAIQATAAYDWPVARLQAKGFDIVAQRYQIEYREPAMLGDELETATWISNVDHATATRRYTVRRTSDETLLAQAQASMIWVDATTRKPIPIPPDFLADAAPNIAHESPPDRA